MPRVFISYSHDSKEHSDRVLALANKLRADGVDTVIDQYMFPGGPPEGWPAWSEEQVREAEQVLIAPTEAYSRRYDLEEVSKAGLGVTAGARAIRQLTYEAGGQSQKFQIILFAAEDEGRIPIQLKSYHFFRLYQKGGYDELLTRLSGPSVPTAPRQDRSLKISWPSALPDYLPVLADRKAELDIFQRMVTGRSSQRILIMRGRSGTGKTTLLREYVAYARRLGCSATLVDFKGSPSIDDLFEVLRLDLGRQTLSSSYNAKDTSRFYQLISDFQQLSRPLLLVFDTYEQAPSDAQTWLERQLLPRIRSAPGLVVVISGQQTPESDKHPWRALAESVELQPITAVDDWREFAMRLWEKNSLQDGHIHGVLAATGGDPATTYAVLESLVKQMR